MSTITAPPDLLRLVERAGPGLGLPASAYTSAEVFAADLDRVFARSWLFAGHTADVTAPGDFRVVDVAGEQIIIWHGRDGVLRAHYNVCRHRGSRLTFDRCGTATALACPYHQWAYRSDGSLAGARLMGDAFDPTAFPLAPVALRDLAGLLFVCLADEPPPFDAASAAIAPQLVAHDLYDTVVVARETYDVAANWKTLVENNRECYHCRVAHPEFSLANYDVGLPGDPRSPAEYADRLAAATARWQELGLHPETVSFPDGEWFRVARMPLKDGYVTETVDGTPAAPLLGRLASPDVGSLRLVGLPNFWGHVNADYAMTTRLDPREPDRTRVEVCFLVRADARPGVDCDVEKLATVLRTTFEQDIELCESVAAGLGSRGFRPGPYSPVVESSVEGFVTWYLHRLSGERSADRRSA